MSRRGDCIHRTTLHRPKHNQINGLMQSDIGPLPIGGLNKKEAEEELAKSISDFKNMAFLGSSSRFINDQKEAFADINNGTMPSVLQNDY